MALLRKGRATACIISSRFGRKPDRALGETNAVFELSQELVDRRQFLQIIGAKQLPTPSPRSVDAGLETGAGRGDEWSLDRMA